MDGSITATFGHYLRRRAVATGNNQNSHDSQIPATAAGGSSSAERTDLALSSGHDLEISLQAGSDSLRGNRR